MPKKPKYELTSEQVEAIKQATKSTNAKVAKRALMIYALHMGHHPREVARLHGVAMSTVYYTVGKYREGGIEGLQHRRKPGRPRALSEEQQAELVRVVETAPQELGYQFTIWTIERLRHYMREEWGLDVSPGTVTNTLKRMGYVYRRPKKSLEHVQDKAAVEAFKRLLPELKKEHKQVSLGSSLWTKRDSN
jgi:transposase